MRFEIPSTVTREAKTALTPFYALAEHFSRNPQPTPGSVEEWDQQAAAMDAAFGPMTQANADALKVVVAEDSIGGVPVLRVTSPEHRPSRRTLLYVHGGGYVFFSARTSLTVPALTAVATGDEVISIDYTLAPRGNWRTATDQVLAVYQAMLSDREASEIGLLGDSAGGALVAGSALKARDNGLPLPGALYLLSPWADITDAGDTYVTLATADPTLTAASLTSSASAYVEAQDRKNPYVSPVYGDYRGAFPPTLIQGGTREIFVSNCVRLYQAIRSGGHEAVLDLYEGMPHVFQALIPFTPESKISVARAADFLDQHLASRRS